MDGIREGDHFYNLLKHETRKARYLKQDCFQCNAGVANVLPTPKKQTIRKGVRHSENLPDVIFRWSLYVKPRQTKPIALGSLTCVRVVFETQIDSKEVLYFVHDLSCKSSAEKG